MAIERIRKRMGEVVSFDRLKIERAISNANDATGSGMTPEVITAVTDKVVAELEQRFEEKVPDVEDIQDTVERAIAEEGFFTVAKSYILYREHQKQLREREREQTIEKAKGHQINVTKRNGAVVPFDVNEITSAVSDCCRAFRRHIDIDGVVRDAMRNLYNGIKTKDINAAVIMALRARIERNPVYADAAARFLFNDLYKDVLGHTEWQENFTNIYRQGLAASIEAGILSGRLDPRLRTFDLPALASAIQPERDHLFRYLGAQTLYDRYFMRDHEQRIMEAPQHFWMRVAMGLCLEEEHKIEQAIEFYTVMSQLHYVPSTPTLFHSGTTHPQMSSCYLTTVEDDLNHIFKNIGDNAQLSKWSGGLGGDWTNIRGTGALIKSTNVGSQGVVPFLKIVDAATAAINRSGKRRGATCVYLETWHYDIEDFLELRKNTGDDRRRTHDTNTANWIPDLFMKRVMHDQTWTLFSPEEVPDLHHIYGKEFERKYEEYERQAAAGKIRLFKQVPAQELWRKMVTMLFETGHPWMTFKDACNIRSPQDHAGVVHSSNLCTEITLNTSAAETAVCNLGSVNLPRHIEDSRLNREQLEHTVATAMRMLDNVIDLNFYPTVEAKNSNLRHRPVGLGIMGLQDALYELDLSFDSAAAVQFSDETMEFISYHAILASSQLAKERGAYASYSGSKWDRGIFPLDTLALLEEERGISTGIPPTARLDWDTVRAHVAEHGMRNSNCMAIAPTATNANINGVVPSIEPIYKNIYTKSNFSGEFTIINRYLVQDLQDRGLWNDTMVAKLKEHDGSVQEIEEIPADLKAKYKEVFEIEPVWVIRHAAHRGKWIDQSQSVNLFVRTTSGRQIAEMYMMAWKMGLKTTYYLRSLGASAVEKSTIDIPKKAAQPSAAPDPVSAAAAAQTAPARVSVSLPASPAGAFGEGAPSHMPTEALGNTESFSGAEPASAAISQGIQTPASGSALAGAAAEMRNEGHDFSLKPHVYIAEDAICEACE
ncbi:MAG: ribonucleoside-diphosphate reductase subunit alpha [Candidatus Andersenbacteria bacterium CG10_big_fil_rev_8_21_14_0_10_54_11]|uniref:Ribonucleoside-diphosphate reductase n=1 Tax=Candidatus Andersenbacteria bacterium CG10_big_fil_rev_8_21_14_0_10_54_11 TaxID=1974485 RepID=A0A2M6WZ54_9BACT|nr:MAG: ribonucleoside-diphosphate reductase subunit alpha [Candidatus Andersenbacteria bacterium CG10_big_fil_rev_8_21_14_0_10_54_11]